MVKGRPLAGAPFAYLGKKEGAVARQDQRGAVLGHGLGRSPLKTCHWHVFARAEARAGAHYSHSIVPGGFEVMS